SAAGRSMSTNGCGRPRPRAFSGKVESGFPVRKCDHSRIYSADSIGLMLCWASWYKFERRILHDPQDEGGEETSDADCGRLLSRFVECCGFARRIGGRR